MKKYGPNYPKLRRTVGALQRACDQFWNQRGKHVGLKTSLDHDVESELIKAEIYARKGEVPKMKTCLYFANEYAQKVGHEIPEETKARIERIGYEAGIPLYLTDAEEWARKGEEFTMKRFLDLADRCAQKTGQNVSEERARIERIGYEVAVPVRLAKAEKCARRGYELTMERFLDLADRYAQKTGQKIPEERRAEIERLGYERAIPVKLRDAEKCARKGHESGMKFDLYLVKKYARQVGQNVSKQILEIKKIGYEAGIPVGLVDAVRIFFKEIFG